MTYSLILWSCDEAIPMISKVSKKIRHPPNRIIDQVKTLTGLTISETIYKQWMIGKIGKKSFESE